MKQFFVFLSVSLLSISINAQSITLNDLIKICTLDQDEVRLFMQKKGFAYDGFTEKSVKYVFSLNFISADAKSVVTYQVRENKNVSILFLTSEKTYLSIKTTAKSNNYVKGETFVVKDKTCTEYKNRYYVLSFCTSNADNPDYRIQLERVAL
jgi:hypothetical protein